MDYLHNEVGCGYCGAKYSERAFDDDDVRREEALKHLEQLRRDSIEGNCCVGAVGESIDRIVEMAKRNGLL